jgi:hypothetical protein
VESMRKVGSLCAESKTQKLTMRYLFVRWKLFNVLAVVPTIAFKSVIGEITSNSLIPTPRWTRAYISRTLLVYFVAEEKQLSAEFRLFSLF